MTQISASPRKLYASPITLREAHEFVRRALNYKSMMEGIIRKALAAVKEPA